MTDSSWWERHLRVPAAPVSVPTGYPQKAVRWEPSYPPTGLRQEVTGVQPGSNGDSSWDRVQRQGYITKAPASSGKSGDCPSCGGSNFFKRRWANTECAPLCTDCGYNGDYFTQSGTLLNAVGMHSSGPVAFARTDNPSAEPHFGVDPNVP